MNSLIEHFKKDIDSQIIILCDAIAESNTPWSKDVSSRLAAFSVQGKSIRGSLFLYTVDLFNHSLLHTALPVAASIEILHSALLIHDDIIDRDSLRRGKDSMHVQYEKEGKTHAVSDIENFGKGMAICVGDIAIFSAFAHLSSIAFPLDLHQKILKTITNEFVTVAFGELHDVALGSFQEVPSMEDVLSMYKRKTARYTFSLPMTLGAIMTNQHSEVIQMFEQLGEMLGLIFQLRDDHLTLYGTTGQVGKTIGNDIRENKNTLYKVLLFGRMSEEDKTRASAIFGNQNITELDIEVVKKLLSTYNIDTEIETIIASYSSRANELIKMLPLPEEKKSELLEIHAFLNNRSR